MEIPEGLSMGVLSWAAIAGLVASITDIDDYINAAKLPGRFNSVRKAIGVVGTFLGDFGTKIKDTFKLPKKLSTTMTAELIGDWFKEATKGIKNVLKLDSPGFVKFIDDVKLGGTGMLDELTVGANKVVTSVKSMLKFDSPGFIKFADDVNIKGTGILDDLTVGANKVKGVFKTLVSPITTLIENAKLSGASVADDVTKGIANVKGMFTSIKSFFTTIFKPIEDLKAALTLDLEGGVIMKALRGVGEFFKPLKTFFSSMWDILKPAKAILGAAKAIPIVGQVIGIVMGIFDFFTGFIDGFSEKESTFDMDGNEIKDQRTTLQKSMDGMKQGVFNLFREMLAIPADLIKDGLSWIMAKLGFPGAEKSMDSFSFTKKFDELFSGEFSFVEIFTKLLTGLGEWFDGMMESAKEIIRNIPGMGDFGKSDADIASDRQAEIKEDIKALEEKRKTALFEKDQFKLGLGKYSDLATSKEDIDAEIAELNKESVDLQAQTASNIGTLTEHAIHGNSIYVQDIGAQELMSKTNDSLEKTAEVKIGSSANDNNIIVAPANMGGGGGGAAPDMRGGGNTTNVVNNSSNSRNIQLKMADNNRPEQQHARRFAAGGPM